MEKLDAKLEGKLDRLGKKLQKDVFGLQKGLANITVELGRIVKQLSTPTTDISSA